MAYLSQEKAMRAVSAVLFPVIVAALAACSGSNTSSGIALGQTAGARDLTLPGLLAERTSAIASAVELNRETPTEAVHHTASGGGASAAPKQASAPTPAPAPEVAPTPAPPPAPPPVEEVKPVLEPAPVLAAAPATQTVAVPVSSGSSTVLEPGQSVTLMTSPMSGAAPATRATDMPEPGRERRPGGIWIDDDCPHGRGGGGGVIGILR